MRPSTTTATAITSPATETSAAASHFKIFIQRDYTRSSAEISPLLDFNAMTEFTRAEVEEAYHHFVAVGDSGNWNAWADLHSEDGTWVEHHLGTFVGREAIRSAIVEVMKPVPMMEFPVGWHNIDGNRVVFYPWQVLPNPPGASPDEEFKFGCVTILEYAGNGLWSYQEDLYNPREGQDVIQRWIAAGGKLATE